MHVLVVYNPENPQALDASVTLGAYFASQGIGCEALSSADRSRALRVTCDLVVALGGDGTMLRCAHLVADCGAPILGLNYGHLGFLANEGNGSVVAAVAAALADELPRQERANLRVDVCLEGEDDDAFESACLGPLAEAPHAFFALNEAALTRGAAGRIVEMGLSIAGSHVAQVRGDGVVVASATGSTAYALSAGGPLVAPGFAGLVVVPVAPHSLTSRAIVTDPNDVVDLALRGGDGDREADLFIDGARLELSAPIARATVRRGPIPTTLLRYNHQGFYAHISEVFF